MPLGDDIERLAEPDGLGERCQVHPHENQVGHHLVTLVLEVVLGEPHGVEAVLFGRLGPVLEIAIAVDDRVVAIATFEGRWSGQPRVGHRHPAVEVDVDAHGLFLGSQTCEHRVDDIVAEVAGKFG